MREIKFRCWWQGVKKMKYFIPGHFEDVRGKGWAMTFIQPEGDGSVYLGEAKVMQYTGLKDKNGKEIYEGDIIKMYRYGVNVGVDERVEFQDGAFWLRYRHYPIHGWINEREGEIEVIGNIYENPELLNREQSVQECDTTKSNQGTES